MDAEQISKLLQFAVGLIKPGPKRILVLEDNPSDAYLILHACAKEKAKVVHVQDQASAFANLETQTFDMAFLDYNLGEGRGNGYTVFRRIQASEATTRCVFIVGCSTDLAAARSNDSFQVIVKGDMLIKEVRRAIHADGTPAGAVMAFFLTCTSLIVGYLLGRPEIGKEVLSAIWSIFK